MDPKYLERRPAEITAQATQAYTRIKQEEHEEDFQRSTEAITKQLQDVEAHDMSKTMKDQIRQWFIECR